MIGYNISGFKDYKWYGDAIFCCFAIGGEFDFCRPDMSSWHFHEAVSRHDSQTWLRMGKIYLLLFILLLSETYIYILTTQILNYFFAFKNQSHAS